MGFLFVACGGFFGSIFRVYLSSSIQRPFIGTWIANITGSLLLAVIVRLHSDGYISNAIWLFSGIGFCGAYTTFSTFGYETIQLLIKKHYFHAGLYIASSFSISLLFVFLILSF
ncbi:fluoride efflux transporter FluC [Virgibacillus sp. W0181]|uniref:fluoride efflux transporter FluC n=1 Tax=Virgibacillus sp. W0181 TaxID=3391581 RepID=UPI003F44E477